MDSPSTWMPLGRWRPTRKNIGSSCRNNGVARFSKVCRQCLTTRNFSSASSRLRRAFITAIERRDSSQAIVKSILAMARELNLDTLAEGVERPQERQWLEEQGCESFQGFLFSRPLNAGDFAALLAAPERRLPPPATTAGNPVATSAPVALGPDA